MNDQTDIYLELLTVVVKRFVTLLGPPGLKKARRVYGLRINDDGIGLSVDVFLSRIACNLA